MTGSSSKLGGVILQTSETEELKNSVLEAKAFVDQKDANYGLLAALCIIGLWATSLGTLLSFDLEKLPVWFICLAVIWQTFLYTGLFITAHDAMHGSVYPQNPKLNHAIGSLALLSYGLFSYKELLKKHWLHHNFPASDRDPDFHSGKRKDPLSWYFYFMCRYWSWKRFLGVLMIFHGTPLLFPIAGKSLSLFWIIPSLLSSIQLFYFGTYLPHREPEEGYNYPHCAQSNLLPIFWSFITCYHFGYHQEHHEYPHVPWWKLPAVNKQQ